VFKTREGFGAAIGRTPIFSQSTTTVDHDVDTAMHDPRGFAGANAST
jgi:hypothetical protein